MGKPKLYTRRRVLDITPAVDRQLERLAAHHERSVPELIRNAIAQVYGLPKDEDRQPSLYERKDRRPEPATPGQPA